jgi:hypothetical protein
MNERKPELIEVVVVVIVLVAVPRSFVLLSF